VTYGNPGEFSPYASAIFPVVLSAGVGGLAAHASGKFEPKQGALVGAGLGVVWSVMQQRKQDAEEVEVIEVESAKPNNVINLSDYRGATFEPSLGAASLEKSQKMSKVLGYAMLGVMGYVAWWNHKQP
jgi:hypothetical protein